MHTIDLNADLGEGGSQDAALMALASSVNIACGGHAGDGESIRRAVELALETQVAIGAHPGYEDAGNFGRKPLQLSCEEIRSLTLRQLGRILDIHPNLHHVKPHGALYNESNRNEAMAVALVAAIAEISPDTILYCPPHGELSKAAALSGIAVCGEGFIDRRYLDDGSLCPRSEKMALIEDPGEAMSQALKIALRQTVTTLSGAAIPLKAGTLCVHGDSPNALITLKLSRSLLEDTGIRISAP
jgi:UPF0271 protein